MCLTQLSSTQAHFLCTHVPVIYKVSINYRRISLRHNLSMNTTTGKVPGSILGGVTGNFVRGIRKFHRPESTQPLKMSTGYSWGKEGRCVRLTTNHLQVPMSRNLEVLTSQNPLGPIVLQWDCFTFFLFLLYIVERNSEHTHEEQRYKLSMPYFNQNPS
jgi:hypothetical protein